MDQSLKSQTTIENEDELVAAITGAIAVVLKTSTENIVIRNIRRISESTPAWARAGRMEQMNSRGFY